MFQFGLHIKTAEQSMFLGSQTESQTGCETTQADNAPILVEKANNQANLGSMAPAVPALGNDENVRRGSLSPLRPVSDDDLLVWYRLVSEQQVIFI